MALKAAEKSTSVEVCGRRTHAQQLEQQQKTVELGDGGEKDEKLVDLWQSIRTQLMEGSGSRTGPV